MCYQIPALMTDGVAVVVSPPISLMKDQVDALRSNGIAADALNSNNDESVNRIIRGRCVQGELKILYISPERLILDMMAEREREGLLDCHRRGSLHLAVGTRFQA